jgi:carbon monoxide dehydrogenase subunit G
MIIEQAFTINASLEDTARYFADAARVAACVPGVEDLVEVSPNSYKAVLVVRLGPIRATFQGSVEVDYSGAPARLTAAGEGRDRSTGSIAKVSGSADLVETSPGVTTVTAVADLALRGRMAHFGTGVIRAAAGEMVKEFAKLTNASFIELTRSDHDTAGLRRAEPKTTKAPGVVGVVLRGLAKAIIRQPRSWVSRWRSKFAAGRRRQS